MQEIVRHKEEGKKFNTFDGDLQRSNHQFIDGVNAGRMDRHNDKWKSDSIQEVIAKNKDQS